MAAPSEVRPIEVPPHASRMLEGRTIRRILGIVLIGAIAGAYFVLTDLPRLDAIREEVAIATAVDVARAGVPADQVSNCFQGFCFEDDVGFVQRWWEFSRTYLALIWSGLALAIAIAAITDGFLFPSRAGPAFGTWRTAGAAARSRSADSSLVPIGGRSAEIASLGVGSFNAPAVALMIVLFGPVVWMTRFGVAIVVVIPILLLAPRGDAGSITGDPANPEVVAALRHSARAMWLFGLRLVPAFLAVAFLGGLVTQYFTEEGVTAVAGDHLLGVLLAIVVGLLLGIPLTFGVPLAALVLLVGADPVIVGVFIAAASMAGPRTLFALIHTGPRLLAIGLVVLLLAASLGGQAVARVAIEATSGPTIAWDGEHCTYGGPARLGPQVHDFTIRNETEDGGDGHTLAIVVGQLPPNVSVDHFVATVGAEPTAPLPPWFTVAGTQEFIFPGTEQRTEITLHDPGTYAAVCLDGGGFYVIFEFSMPQPMGWFDEFRSTFNGYVAEPTFEVAG